nr:3-ketoacyl-ACP reductase [Cohnella hashimotonis]
MQNKGVYTVAQTIKGKVAIVTGAGKGIGKAVALELAREGVHVGLIARTEKDLLDAARDIQALGGKVAYAAADVSSLPEVEQAVDKITRDIGAADILINNAGIGTFEKLVEMDPAHWKKIIEVNLLGTFYVTRTVLPQLIAKNGGDIINISSTNGLNGAPGSSAYSASKFGVIGLTESLAQEVRRNNIRVTALTPSTIATDLAKSSSLIPEGKDEQYMHPEDIAEYIVAQLKLSQRMYIKTASMLNTNPF